MVPKVFEQLKFYCILYMYLPYAFRVVAVFYLQEQLLNVSVHVIHYEEPQKDIL